jgi:hypothetical protein
VFCGAVSCSVCAAVVVVTVDVDEDEFRHYVINEDLLVVNEEFYYDIEKDIIYDTPCEKGPSFEEDELPF